MNQKGRLDLIEYETSEWMQNDQALEEHMKSIPKINNVHEKIVKICNTEIMRKHYLK